MNRHWNSYLNRTLSRRELLRVSSAGFGICALAGLLGEQQLRAAAAAGANPLAVKAPHFPARAKRVIFLFMHGGPSQVDTFDYKPLLKRDHGKPLPFARPKVVSERDLQPAEVALGVQAVRAERHVGKRVCSRRLRSGWTTSASSNPCGDRTRGTAARCWRLHTGSDTFVRPVMGSWITYGLGSENQNMPGYRHDLPHAEPRRREQLQLRHFCRRRTRERRSARWGSRRATPRFRSSRTRRRRATSSAWNSTSRRS